MQETPLNLECVTGYDLPALAANLFTAFIVGTILYIILKKVLENWTGNNWDIIWISFAIVCGLGVLYSDNLWTYVKAREGKAFQNALTGVLIVYLNRFHFKCWYTRPEGDEITFQRHEQIVASMEKHNAVYFDSKDGLKFFIEYEFLLVRGRSAEDLSHSLTYDWDDIKRWSQAILTSWFTALGSRNDAIDLLYHKSEAQYESSNLFNGDQYKSEFEQKTGTKITGLVIKVLSLVPASQQIFEKRAIVNMLESTMTRFANITTPKEASIAAQLALGLTTREIRSMEYSGLPQNVTALAVGDGAGIATVGSKSEEPKDPKKK